MGSTRVEGAYKLTEHVENDGHHRNRGKSGDNFDIADIRKTGKGEVLREEDFSPVSCHREGDEVKSTRPQGEGL